jgi:hypothetical protein
MSFYAGVTGRGGRVGPRLFGACVASVVTSIITVLIVDRYFVTGLPKSMYVTVAAFATVGFYFLFVAPVPLLIAAAHDVALGERRGRTMLLHGALLVCALLFNPILQKLPGFDTEYANFMLERAKALDIVGKTEEETIALLGRPSYLLGESADDKQLRYRHWLPILWDAQFYVRVRAGRAEIVGIDWD